ncbi:hypothetical protein CAPTEDRAFT_190085 [Capitella teleta]|uniref:Uncharacterized protein n=1 Tax=Capitella teleta TaxID=283909 RepID=R7TFF0_CAPTE|nr:hypothetical protein CAPTEDRAFT_190085 [Capitella teleta]|eukprot:ELT89746.1 hypothetical protein CAPTEDRAFT_190085 [Capitella teleta]
MAHEAPCYEVPCVINGEVAALPPNNKSKPVSTKEMIQMARLFNCQPSLWFVVLTVIIDLLKYLLLLQHEDYSTMFGYPNDIAVLKFKIPIRLNDKVLPEKNEDFDS